MLAFKKLKKKVTGLKVITIKPAPYPFIFILRVFRTLYFMILLLKIKTFIKINTNLNTYTEINFVNYNFILKYKFNFAFYRLIKVKAIIGLIIFTYNIYWVEMALINKKGITRYIKRFYMAIN